MKIRNGFVSNSSSSSFVYIVDAEAHKQALAQVDDSKEILERIFSCRNEQRKFGDRDVLIVAGGDYSGYNIKGNLSCEDISDEEIESAGYEELWEFWSEEVDKKWEEYKSYISKNSYIEKWEDH